MQQFNPDTPVVLIGIKTDLRYKCGENRTDDGMQREKLISYKQGIEMAERIKAVKYMECSPKSGDGVKSVIEEVIRIVTSEKIQTSTSNCFVL